MKTKIQLNSINKVADFVKDCQVLKGDIDVSFGKYVVDGKSIMGIFSLPLSDYVEVEIRNASEEEINRFTTDVLSKYQ